MALSVDKFKFGSKSIADMYFGTTAVKQLYFGTTLIWEKGGSTEKILVAGSQDVAIEYVPTSDITVTTVSIFTDEISAQTACYFRIIEESGIVVAETNTSTVTTDVTLYELAGEKRTATIDPVTLYAGKKYYIYFCEQGYSDAFKPAYFQSTEGNYKSFTEWSLINNTIDMTDFGDYIGVCSGDQGIIDFFNSNENDYMYWRTGTGSDYSIFTNQRVFVRSSTACDCDFAGVYSEYAATTLDSIMQLEPKKLFLYTGNTWTDQGLTNNYFYVKTNDIPNSAYSGLYTDTVTPLTIGKDKYFTYHKAWAGKLYKMNYDVAEIATFEQTAAINQVVELLLKYDNDYTTYRAVSGSLLNVYNGLWQRSVSGDLKIIDAGTPYTGEYTSETLPLNENDILYINNSFRYNGSAIAGTDALYQYTSGSFNLLINAWNGGSVTNIFNIVQNADAYSTVPVSTTISAVDPSQLIKQTIVPDVMYAEADLSTDKKFYLEINGTEV